MTSSFDSATGEWKKQAAIQAAVCKVHSKFDIEKDLAEDIISITMVPINELHLWKPRLLTVLLDILIDELLVLLRRRRGPVRIGVLPCTPSDFHNMW